MPTDQTNNHPKTTHKCSFCGKRQVQRLIAGPGNVFICDECIDLCREILEAERVPSTPHSDQDSTTLPETTNPEAPSQTPHSCSFCNKPQDQVQSLIAGPGNVFICDECIDARRKILEDESIILIPHLAQNTSTLLQTTNSKAPSQTSYSCTFCGKPQDQVQRLVAGPGNFLICNECIALHRKRIEEQYAPSTPYPDPNISALPQTINSKANFQKLYYCSFCSKSQDQVQRLIAGPKGIYICNECVGLCMETIEEEMEEGKK